jgi:SAM-dependent methyltransferase/ribosomal protein S18 acetylase RimI-like enzyme
MSEVDEIVRRYERRKERGMELGVSIYSELLPNVYLSRQEKERTIIRWIRKCGLEPLSEKRLLEIGCGNGSDLLWLMHLGFNPDNLVANELIEERALVTRSRLPSGIQVLSGDASELPLEPESFDIVYQSMVFTSVLDDAFRQKLADHIWALAKPGGGILWYDFLYSNPRNPDVVGMPLRRVRELFPDAEVLSWRLTLAPPLSRLVTRFHGALYGLFDVFPFLRTHVLCWIKKKGACGVCNGLRKGSSGPGSESSRALKGHVQMMCRNDVHTVVSVHQRAFPNFFLTVLGPRFLEQLYMGLLDEPDPIAFVYKTAEGATIGFVAGSKNVRGVYFRILLRRAPQLVLVSFRQRVWKLAVFRRFLETIRDSRRSGSSGILMSIAVLPDSQRCGAGKQLVWAFLKRSNVLGVRQVMLSTDAFNNEATNAFYRDLGFTLERETTDAGGRALNVYTIGTRDVAPDRRPPAASG